jgi:hypothetical protein
MFGILGAILTIYGLATASDTAMYQHSLGININLWWGIAFLAFAAAMLLLAFSAGRKEPSSPSNQPDSTTSGEKFR